jgi:biopolymer transport protein ExbB/TolQ
MRWIWSRTPVAVRATVPARHRRAVAWVVWGAFTAGLLGLAATVAGLVHAFGSVADVDPSQKAEVLAQGISDAMNYTAAGLVAQDVGCAIALVAGWKLLRLCNAAAAPAG